MHGSKVIALISRLVLVCTVLMIAATAFAVPPNSFSYQGRLTDPGGNPVPDGLYTVSFAVWPTPTGGSPIWSSGAMLVTLSDGLFSVLLGESPQPSLPTSLFADSVTYLGITVGGDPEIVPRTRIASSPYALRATEPGIAQNIGSVGLFSAPGVPDNIVSVTISIPADGYILVLADGQSSVIGTAGTNTQIQFGLGEVSGGMPANGVFLAGSQATPTNEAIHDQFSNSATYFKTAGTYTFYLTGFRGNASTLAFFTYCHLKALYFPTSYGAVISPVPPSDANAFSSSTAISGQGNESPMKLVDLRELELKAARREAELQKTQNGILIDKLKQSKVDSVHEHNRK